MVKTLYLMRHGETLFNQLHKIQGWCDSPLTAVGFKQAEIAGNYFKKHGIFLEEAYCSTSERACDTLEQVTPLPYQRIKGLREWHFGRFEGEGEFLNPPLPYGDFFVEYGGESESQVRQRIADTLQQLMENAKGKNVLVVSHGGSCRQFMRYWQHNTSIDQQEPLRNCCILKFSFSDEGTFKLLQIINHDFTGLTGERSGQ